MSTSAQTTPQPAFGLKLPERYRIRRHIATGGMASVWCAKDGVLGRDVAIKVLSDRFADDEFAVRRFMREARAAARVSNHPHVVTIYDVGDIEAEGDGPAPRAFIVMEYLAGGTVADALRCQAVTRDETQRWVAEAASALDHAHQRGIVHRDIKPANFLLDRTRGLHVADFGIAHLQSEDTITSSGQLFGTAAYLAPEQALGHDATGASDRYALAVAAFELLTGGRPFTATHFAAQARQHIEQAPPKASERQPSLPPAVDEVLTRGMAKDPGERYPTAKAFTDELDAALASHQTVATEALPAPTDRQTQRHRRAGGAAAAGALAAGAAAAGPAGAAEASPARAMARPAPQVPAAGHRAPGAAGAGRNGGGGHAGSRSAPWTAPARSKPRRGGALALVALGIVALGVIALLTQTGGASSPSSAGHHRSALALSTSHHRASHRRRPASTSAASSSTTAAAQSASTSAAAGPAAPAPVTGDAAALQAQGHQELLAGNYPAAISTLHKALAAASPGGLTYAYALYDLGDALLRSGNPAAAIPVLQQRLKINNQIPVVQALLDQALRAAGQAPAAGGSGGASLPAGHRPGHGHGHGGGD
jgi:hypothetical protein